jgi:hypothetical protein
VLRRHPDEFIPSGVLSSRKRRLGNTQWRRVRSAYAGQFGPEDGKREVTWLYNAQIAKLATTLNIAKASPATASDSPER